MNITPHDEQLVAACLGKAIRHSERVSRREHIKGDRIERVNQFINSLRSAILTTNNLQEGKRFVEALCKKEVWYDIGQPSPSANNWSTNFSSAQIHDLLAISKRLSHHTDAQAEQILGDLEEVERGIGGLLVHVEEAQRINNEGEHLVDELVAVFSD